MPVMRIEAEAEIEIGVDSEGGVHRAHNLLVVLRRWLDCAVLSRQYGALIYMYSEVYAQVRVRRNDVGIWVFSRCAAHRCAAHRCAARWCAGALLTGALIMQQLAYKPFLNHINRSTRERIPNTSKICMPGMLNFSTVSRPHCRRPGDPQDL